MKPIVKTTKKTTEVMEFDQAVVSSILTSWIKDNYGYDTVKIQRSENGKIVAIAESVVDGGAKPIGTVKPPKKETTKYEGTSHKWEGLYGAIGEIIDEQRKRKKNFISYDDLLAELHEIEDGQAKKMFVKGSEKLPMSIVRHRLAPSQIIRQAKNQPNLRGVQNSKKDKGLKF